jgi:adenosine deaminase
MDDPPSSKKATVTLSDSELTALPKVVLHDHLDGGLRPATILEIADATGRRMPETDAGALGAWFVQAASAGSLPRFLRTFEHTVAVMQTRANLERVAREAVLDLADDGVIYAELRYAPELHLSEGLALQDVVDAVQAGVADGIAEARDAGRQIRIGTILTAIRQVDRSVEIARLALANRGRGCVGFDIAGAELGFPPSRHAEAFAVLRNALFPATIHAGEVDGPSSVAEAVGLGSARRIGHGLRIVEDIQGADSDEPRFGTTAAFVRDNRIPLEVCPTSNVQTGAAPSIAEHPISLLRDLGFVVTINPDNRLMCGTSQMREMARLVAQAGWTITDLEVATLEAAWAAFQPYDVREELADAVLAGFGDRASVPEREG